jgi:hypothetical protein
VTEGAAPTSQDALGVVREIMRRSGHEIRNALSAAAVNVEVVRSRSSGQAQGEIKTFAERAVMGIGESSALTDGLLALTSAVLAACQKESISVSRSGGSDSRIEIPIYGGAAERFVSEIERLMNRIGVEIERHGESVIFKVSSRGK